MANEQSCTLPREPLRRLRELGFARLRLPVEWGGLGATLPELFNLLIELSIADTSVTNALRAQWGFTEDLLNTPASPERELWVRRMLPASAPGFLSGLRIALTNGPALVQSLVDSGKPRVLLTNTDVDFPAGLATVVRTADLKDAAREATIRDFFHRVRFRSRRAILRPGCRRSGQSVRPAVAISASGHDARQNDQDITRSNSAVIGHSRRMRQ